MSKHVLRGEVICFAQHSEEVSGTVVSQTWGICYLTLRLHRYFLMPSVQQALGHIRAHTAVSSSAPTWASSVPIYVPA